MIDFDKYKKYLSVIVVIFSVLSVLVMIITFLDMNIIDNMIFHLMENQILLVLFTSFVGVVFSLMYMQFITKIIRRKKIGIFISYNYSSKEYIEKIKNLLSASNNYKIYDFHSILLGQDIQMEIMKMIDASNIFIVFLDEDYLQSKHCFTELEAMIGSGKAIIPILKSSDYISELPSEILKLKCLIISENKSWETLLERSIFEQYRQIRKK